jgi:hypothetical protein
VQAIRDSTRVAVGEDVGLDPGSRVGRENQGPAG